jgi:hypothetical protein
METLLKVLGEYGALGLIVVVPVYILLKGQLSFRYPRSNDK